MSERRKHRLSHAKAVSFDGPVMSRRQKEKVQRLTGIASALGFDAKLSMPRDHDEPAHLRLKDERGNSVHVVVFCGGEASRYASPVDAEQLPPSLSRELSA